MSNEPTTETETDTDDVVELEQLIREDEKLAEIAEHAKERRAAIRAELSRRFDVGTHAVGGRAVVVSQPGRLDAKALERDFPVTEHPELYAAKLDTAQVRDRLAPAVIEAQYTTRGSKQVTIR